MPAPRRPIMQPVLTRAATAAALFLVLAAPGSGSSPTEFRIPIEIRTGTPILDPVPGTSLVTPRLPGYGHTSRPGEPRLPIRILRVAIPEGTVPSIRITDERAVELGPIPVAAVPRRQARDRGEVDRSDGNTGMEEDYVHADAARDPDAEFPAAPVRIGRIGRLRDQRFVEVLVTPVQVRPGRGTGRLVQALRAEVICTPARGAALVMAERPAPEDPVFEEIYRASLLNYEQGRYYRTGATTADAALDTGGTTAVAGASTAATDAAADAAAGTVAYLRAEVSRNGIHRLTYADIEQHAPALLSIDPRAWRLEAEGTSVPIAILDPLGQSGEADGSFDRGDIVEFYGRARTEAPAVLHYDFPDTFPDIYQANDFTDTQVYRLGADPAPGTAPRQGTRDGAPISGFPLAADFEAEARWEENNVYLPLDSADPFFSIPSLLAGSTQASRDLVVAVPAIAPAAATARITVQLRGGSSILASDPDHRTRIWINGDTAGAADFTWEGETIVSRDFTSPQSVLTDPTTIHASAPGLAGVSIDRQYLDFVAIRYRRTFAAAGDRLEFSYPNQSARFQVSGLGSGALAVYEITRTIAGGNEADPVRIAGATNAGGTCTFEVAADPAAPATRTFAVVGPGGVLTPGRIAAVPAAVLRDASRAADLIVVAARDTVDTTVGGPLDLLLAHRLATRGLTGAVVFVDQIYEEFSHGLRDPGAIRSFLAYAYGSWRGPAGNAPPVSMVLLVGDASPDYKDTMRMSGWVDQVPTLMLFNRNSTLGYWSDDNWIGAFLGDDPIPDVLIGRISTRTAAASAAVFDKIRAYEQSPPAGAWKGHATLLAGDGKFAGEASGFEAVQDVAAGYFTVPPYGTPTPPLYYERAPWNGADAAGFRRAIEDEFAAGAAILSYVGHGSFGVWGLDGFFDTAAAVALTNGGRLPLVVNVNCLAGGFHYLGAEGALGEALTNNPAGGAVATFAPSGLSTDVVGETVTRSVLEPTYGRSRGAPLGVIAARSLAALYAEGYVLDVRNYTFLGDPATLFVSPSPPPPTGLAATAGNARVTLSWTPPAIPSAGARIYRAGSAAGRYTPIACETISASACADGSVVNGSTYYYYAVSTDSEGFEGSASNLNDDCDAGPGCVRARPLNPDPPAIPSGLGAHDPGTGAVINVSWAANTEPDLKTYSLYYGTQPRTYSARLDVRAGTTSAILSGLTNGVRYYMALSATNTSGLESAPSAEVSEVPHLIQGIAPPRAITDLRVDRPGADLVLRWSRPTVDIYERPTTVVGYRIYRGTTPGFVPFAGPPLATIADPAATQFTDAGAASLPGNLYYLVTALDANGFESGAGRELPGGIESLTATRVGTGTIRISWPAVTRDLAGYPTSIDHYQVHQTSLPVGRAGLGPSTLAPGMDNVTTLSVDLPLPAGNAYYSVLAVDRRGNISPF
jgi:hypothetical protein